MRENLKKSKLILQASVCVFLLFLPMAGVWLAGYQLEKHLQFPPLTQYVKHAGFSLPVFIFFSSLTLSFIGVFLIYPVIYNRGVKKENMPIFSGKAQKKKANAIIIVGLIFGVIAWAAAWTRMPFMKGLQQFTFSPQWLAYIIVINGLTLKRTGRCMMTHETGKFVKLFLASAAFWWFFEYLNRFVQNWYYLGLENFTPWEYFLYTTPSFATVLPAVLSTSEYLLSFEFMNWNYRNLPSRSCKSPKLAAFVLLLVSCVSLGLLGIYPNIFYPLLWLSPLIIITSLQILTGRKTVLHGMRNGDWRLIVSLAMAALICGFFWEMWNFYSMAKWAYSVPYVNVLHIFEMPLLGYAGYIPFGLECYCVAQLFLKYNKEGK